MKNWKLLSEPIKKNIWDYICDNLKYESQNLEIEILHIPNPKMCFEVFSFFKLEPFEYFYNELNEFAIKLFKKIAKDKIIYAMDWQHSCYSFDPNLPFEKNEFSDGCLPGCNIWPIPFFPNGDHLFFLTSDYKNGVFGDGFNGEIHFWGHEMLNALTTIKIPKILTNRISTLQQEQRLK